MKKKKRTLLAVLLILLALLAALAVWQRNNLKAVIEYATGSQEDIEQKLEQNQQAINDAVTNNPGITVRDVTEEEKAALRDGTLTQEELAERLTETPTPSETPDETPKPSTETPKPSTETQQPPAQTQQPEQSEYDKQLSAVVAKVYVLREEFTIALDNLQAEATAAYHAMAPEERTGSKLTKFVSDFLARGTSLEKDCDAKMDAIVAELDALIRANNGDLSIIDTVVETYASEKSLKKAWYMAELEKKGLA